jgi:hypothetical protein
MYQHQHEPLPLEQLKDVPQPVAVLIAVASDLIELSTLQSFSLG